MLNIIDDLNNSNLSPESFLLSFNISNMSRSIDSKMRTSSVIKFLDERMCKVSPVQCVIETLELCLSCNNSVFNNTNYIQTDGTAQGPHMLYSHSDIVTTGHENKVSGYDLPPKVWKRFRDDVFVVWTQDIIKLPIFLDYLNNINVRKN